MEDSSIQPTSLGHGMIRLSSSGGKGEGGIAQ